jgi:hypothetical protein
MQKAPDCDMVLVHDDDLVAIEDPSYGAVSEYSTGSHIVFFYVSSHQKLLNQIRWWISFEGPI